MNKPLNIHQIFKIAGKSCSLVLYPDLKNMKSIDELFTRNIFSYLPFTNHSCVIMYLTKDNFGHWCLLNRINNNGIIEYHFLDSYGEVLDSQLDHIPESYRIKSNQVIPYLSRLLLKSNNPVHYNERQMQIMSNDISTCGVYVALYLKHNNLTVEEFVNIILDNAKKYKITPDELVVKLTNFL